MSLRDQVLKVHDVYSQRRIRSADQDLKPVGQTTRNKVLLLFRDILSGARGGYADHNAERLWSEVHNLLQHRLGRPTLAREMQAYGSLDYNVIPKDLFMFLAECTSEEFLDFVELSFKVDHPPEASGSSGQVIEALNEIFRIDDLPYHLTDYVKIEEESIGPLFPGGGVRSLKEIKTVAFPKIIVVGEEVVYEEAVAPALEALEAPHFAVPNTEFRDALEHYRRGRHKECLTSCGSSLESVLKVICDRKRWAFNSADTLGPLLDIVIPKLGLEPAFKEKFKLVGNIRNTLSSSHGGGKAQRSPERHFAQYTITTTAGIIVLLIAVAEGGKSWAVTSPAKLNELNHAEMPARDLLVRVGWIFVPRETLAAEREDERKVLLHGRLTAALMRLNEWMTEDQAQRVIFNLQHLDETGLARNQAIHTYLAYGMPLTIDRSGRQETPTVRFFDFDHPEPGVGLNEYVVTTQLRVRRGNERGGERASEDDERVVKPDLVLFVNGIPLVVMEAKSPTLLEVWKTQAVKQLSRYQEAGPEWHGAGAPELFDTNLMCVALCGADAAFGALSAPENAYAGWKSIEPFTEPEFERRLGTPPEGQARLIAGLLNPPVLLDILRDYVVFEHERGRLVKKLPRYQQYRAVRQAVPRILDGCTPEERGGVVWHTQGSGKSLTMLWLAVKLRRSRALRNPTIVVVTDRTQLDRQITATFQRTSVVEPERATSTRRLRELLGTNNGRTIMTTIQKFEDVLNAPRGPGRPYQRRRQRYRDGRRGPPHAVRPPRREDARRPCRRRRSWASRARPSTRTSVARLSASSAV